MAPPDVGIFKGVHCCPPADDASQAHSQVTASDEAFRSVRERMEVAESLSAGHQALLEAKDVECSSAVSAERVLRLQLEERVTVMDRQAQVC